MNISSNEINEVTKEWIIQVSALVRVIEEHDGVQEESQYLLEVGEICGVDNMDTPISLEGSDRANKLKARICGYAVERGWKVLPGIIGF